MTLKQCLLRHGLHDVGVDVLWDVGRQEVSSRMLEDQLRSTLF